MATTANSQYATVETLMIHWFVVERECALIQMCVCATLFLFLDIQEVIAVILFATADILIELLELKPSIKPQLLLLI
ncbi:hypothetical protein D3C80_2041520 [compost metagenome]